MPVGLLPAARIVIGVLLGETRDIGSPSSNPRGFVNFQRSMLGDEVEVVIEVKKLRTMHDRATGDDYVGD